MKNKQAISKEEFIKRCKENHQDIYDYSLVDYINNNTKIKIICKDHGQFEQVPSSHIKGIGCSRCKKSKQHSEQQIKWLNLISSELKINILHNDNGLEYAIKNSRYRADGYCELLNTIFEYHGCFWHGCTRCYSDRNAINKITKYSYEQLYKNTKIKEEHYKKKI